MKSASFTESGREFHVVEPQISNERSPNLIVFDGAAQPDSCDLQNVDSIAAGLSRLWHNSQRCSLGRDHAALWKKIIQRLKTIKHGLKSMRWVTRSQCSRSLKSGVIWSYRTVTENQPRRHVQNRLQPIELILGYANQNAVTIVNSWNDELIHELNRGRCRQGMAERLYPA